MQKEKTRGIKSLFISLLICAVLFVIISAVMTAFCYAGENPLGSVRLYSFAAFLLSGAIAAFVNAKRGGDGSFGTVFLTSLFFGFILLLFSVLFSGGKIGGNALMNIISYLLVSGLFTFLGTQKPKRHRRARR